MNNAKNKIPRPIELLAPAANAEIAREAILHGADAVYIGASSHGARKAAANSVEDIASLVKFAHRFRARVYVTVNTIVYESEKAGVERLVRDLYRAGVDALIVQDMGILRMNIPPIALHASTQCDNRTLEKVRFLEEVGFSQVVLARELTVVEIKKICSSVSVPVECFVHGALCVSYSGRCHASYSCSGRSANRGECSQVCRLPYTLIDSAGRVLVRDKHLLSLKDLNASSLVSDLIEAGVSSFKIEGRLKEVDYVKNVTAAYRKIIDGVIASAPDSYCRSSYGVSTVAFEPVLSKSFNRGFTHYFMENRRPTAIASIRTPKSMGEEIVDFKDLNNGDGISFFDRDGNYTGVNINRMDNGRIKTARRVDIPKDATVYRTYDREWQQMMERETAVRKIRVDMTLSDNVLSASDERGVMAAVPLGFVPQKAERPGDLRKVLGKLGNTVYELRSLELKTTEKDVFIPASILTDARRRLIESLDMAAESTYTFDMRRRENHDALFLVDRLDYRDNVANSLARDFYTGHGVKEMEPALETGLSADGKVVMTTRHCILRELGWCKKEGKFDAEKIKEPLFLRSGSLCMSLEFDCGICEMKVRKES